MLNECVTIDGLLLGFSHRADLPLYALLTIAWQCRPFIEQGRPGQGQSNQMHAAVPVPASLVGKTHELSEMKGRVLTRLPVKPYEPAGSWASHTYYTFLLLRTAGCAV
jgi:hypothetical protein